MIETFQLKGGMYELEFGYNANLDGYTTLMSDMLKFSAKSVRKMNMFY